MVRSKLNLKNNAFSLLEVIVTVAILSIGMVVILQAFSFSARVTGLSCDITNAVFLAEDKLQELEFEEKKDRIIEGKKNNKKDKFQWTYTIALVSEPPDLKLYELSLDITWQRLNRKEKLNLNTYFKNLK